MYILGVNSAYHETSASLLKDGMLIAAVEEERFTRIKHGKSSAINNPHELPIQAIRYCLETAGITLSDVASIGFSLDPERRLANKDVKDRVVAGSWGSDEGEREFYRLLNLVPQKFHEMGFIGEFTWIEHHLCHAASTFYPSPFSQAAVLTIDGIGESSSTALAFGDGQDLTVLQEIPYPASIGFLWEKISKFLGFTEYDAYKVMGLAAYGNPTRFAEEFQRLIWPLPDGTFAVDKTLLCFRVEDYRALEGLFGTPRRVHDQPLLEVHQDIAAGLQQVTNQLVLHLVEHLYGQTGSLNLCIAGGVALNCMANEVVHRSGPFKHLYIQPAAHDAGTALGAALVIWNRLALRESREVMAHAYWGPSFSNDEIEKALQAMNLQYERMPSIERAVAELLAGGYIVGWFQGRMEFGPRALGNRSLLADPRNPHMREILNSKIKHREAFRPLAPSVLYEEAHEWFDMGEPTIASDFMLMAYPTKECMKARIPAVVHVDGSSRIHTVRKEVNRRYHQLIAEFFALTGVPLVLNTSFNDSEPIVCSPGDAIATFLKTQMDYLAIGDFLFDRQKNS